MSQLAELPPELQASRPLKVMSDAISNGRLAHAILLHGDNFQAIEQVAHVIAALLLKTDKPIARHPDYFSLRPKGRSRTIGVGQSSERVNGQWPENSMRRLIHDLNLSPQAGERKVAIVYEVDRMRKEPANAFLKTLEEPPADTTIFLLTTRPYSLLPTIRSRCLNIALPSMLGEIKDEEWLEWRRDYHQWIEKLQHSKPSSKSASDFIMTIYGLVFRFEAILKRLNGVIWDAYKESMPENLPDEQKEALEAGFTKGLRSQLFAEIEKETHAAGKRFLAEGAAPKLIEVVRELESSVGLLEVNLNELVALENFLLKSLRIWAR